MGRDIIARGMASGAIKVNINAGHIFVDNTTRDAYFVTNPTELVENMYVYCNSKLQQYDGSIWVDRTPAIKGETGTGVPTGGTTNQVLTKNSNGNYDFSWIDLSGGGDMVKSFYDTANKQVDVYDMDNMEDGTTYVKTENNFTHENKTILDNTSGTNTGDETAATIKNKLGASSATTDGYLTKEDFTTFAKTLNSVETGTTVSISDAEDNVYFNNIVVNGKTTQKTYDGVQMMDVTLTYLKTINTTGSWINNIYTLNGLSYKIITNQNDCVLEIKVSGMGTLNTNFYIRAVGTPINAGSYWIKGCPTGGMTDSYWLRLVLGGSLNRNDIGAGSAVTPATNTTYECYIRIYPSIAMNHSFYPMLSTEVNKLHIYEPFTGNSPSPSVGYPEPLIPIGGVDKSLNLSINSTETSIQLSDTLYNTDKLSIYNKETCDNFGIIYNSAYENNIGVFKFSKTIASYSGQIITGDYDSSTGGLDGGAIIVYYDDELPEFIPLAYSQQEIYKNLKQAETMSISTEDLATLNIYYNKANYTIKTLFDNITFLQATKQDIIFIDTTITSAKFNELLKSSSKLKTFYFLSGTYSLKQLRIKSNTHIILDKNTIINVADNSHLFFNFELTDTDVLEYNGEGNITIEGGTINGHIASFIHGYNIVFKNIKANNCPRDHYFEINSCKNVTIKGCTFNGMVEQPIDRQYVEFIQIEQAKHDAFPHLGNVNSPTFDNTPSTNIEIDGNIFDKGLNTFAYAYAAIGSHSSSPQYLGFIFIKKNKFYNFTWGAVSMRSWEQVDIDDNYFENCKTATYFKYDNKDINFENNHVYNCESAVYLYNGTLSSMNNLNIDKNHFDGCLHRINCEIEEGVEKVVNGGKIFDTNNYIENSGTDIIIGKEFYSTFGNTYKTINEKVGYVLLLDTVSNITINSCKFEDIQLDDGEETYSICKVINSYEKLNIKNNIHDNTKLYDAVNGSDEFIYSGDKFTLNKTLLATSWNESSPYILELDVTTNGAIINENNFKINIYPIYPTDMAEAKTMMENYNYVSRADVLANNIVIFTCYDFKPTSDIDIKLELENK